MLNCIVQVVVSLISSDNASRYDVSLARRDNSSSLVRKENEASPVTVDGLMPGATYLVTALAVGVTGLRSELADGDQPITTGR